jgi:hypothetical protein
MSSGLYSGVSGLALGTGLYKGVSGLWSGASGLIDGFGGPASALSLNFLSGTLDSRITFTRGSNATLIDSTGRIAYAPANLNLQSEGFDTASWGKTLCTVTANTITSPDGTVNADLVTDNSTSGTELSQTVTVISGAIVAHSRYFKYGNNQWVRLALGDATNFVRGWFDIQNGVVGATTVGGTGGNASVAITNVGNGWYRCTLIGSLTGITSYACISMTATANSNTTRVSGGTYYVWGAQAELITYQTTASPYVATTSAAYYGPRFEYDPITLASCGLLIEETRTNLFLQSEAFDTASWTKSGGSTVPVTTNTAPDGTASADTIQAAATTSYVSQVVTFTGNGSKAFSVFLKAGTATVTRLVLRDTTPTATNRGGVNITWTAGVPSGVATDGGTLQGIDAYPNGWYRVRMLAVGVVAANSNEFRFSPDTSAGTGTTIFWGAQAENGAFSTSYIPTTTAPVPRNADIATMTGTNFSSWYNASEGTFVSSFEASPNTFTTYVAASNGVVAQNSMHMDNDGAGNMRAAYYSGSAPVALLGLGAVGTLGAVNKMASAYKVNDFAASRNGGAVVADTLGAVPVGVVQLNIGADPSGAATNVSNTHIRSITYYNTRLTDAQLQALSV